MIEIIYSIIAFLLLWVPAFLCHEIMHSLEARRQGCKTRIDMWIHKGIPSMRCIVTEGTLKNKWLFALAGGLYTSIILIIISWITSGIPWLSTAVGTLGIINFIYSLYESTFLHKIPLATYMKYHYFVYAIGIVIGIIMYYYIFGVM